MKRVLLTLLTGIFISQQAFAVVPSQEQIEQFKQLPKAQQEALAKQYGIDLSDINQTSTSKKIENPEVVKPRPSKKQTSTDEKVTGEDTTAQSTQDLLYSQNMDEAFFYANKDNKIDLEDEKVDKKKAPKKEPLKPFGYELFAGSPTTFAPATDVPVPHEYVLGPGDTVKVQLFGKEYKSYDVTIDRNGTFMLPETGPIQVVGMSFAEFKEYLNQQIAEKVIGAKASITMGGMRSIRIFVLGEAYKPGAYTVSSLSTITHALFVSGGVTDVGSLRNIQLKRKGKVITTFDLYDLLLKGDTANDYNLLPGDVVFIPPVGKTVGIDGEVKRPAIYELKTTTSAEQLVELAGGMLTTAYPKASKLERLRSDGTRTVIDLNLSESANKRTKLQSGDLLRISSVLDEMENIVRLKGHVHRPGSFAYKPGIKLLDIIPSITDLQPNPDLEYGIIVREEPHIRTLSAIQFSLKEAYKAPDSPSNIRLAPRDQIFIFSAAQQRNIDELLERLEAQARSDEPAKIVSVVGNVRYEGEYPYTENMRVKDLIKASFDLKLETDLDYALLKRRDFINNITDFEVVKLNNAEDLNFKLAPQDKLYVFSVNEEREELFGDLIEEIKLQTNKQNQQKLVTINGEVRFPGTYPLSESMTIAELIDAAGGYTEASYLNDIDLSRFNSNLIDSTEFVIENLSLKETDVNNFVLQPRDTVLIKRIPEWRDHEAVTLVGEFKFPGTYTINKGETLASLIERAGGFTDKAFVDASIFTRSYLKEKEQKLLDEAERRLRRELISNQINAGAAGQSEAVLNMLDQLEGVEASGRMIINKSQLFDIASSVKLRDGDMLVIPTVNQAVSIIGEVYAPTAQIYNKGWTVDDYIDAAGGFNQMAEDDDVYIIKANGRVVSSSSWFTFGELVEPGDTIVVPTNVDPIPQLQIWRDVTSIIYQSTVALAALAAL
ncbi:SLBB domain-containing protein [Catenovulum sp. 2E275]|uniref:SLBB domain-containing protein n=1 Tax=Catenovulum sp. 2E275 TaxID=2980497 RepID=UPI0021D23F6D|nr:SLBB domain-containing protein [Catenovulum sp. 2E275]MCU4677327.1 SLBB domain-containing protein [Catenovulum sp. 2E275]